MCLSARDRYWDDGEDDSSRRRPVATSTHDNIAPALALDSKLAEAEMSSQLEPCDIAAGRLQIGDGELNQGTRRPVANDTFVSAFDDAAQVRYGAKRNKEDKKSAPQDDHSLLDSDKASMRPRKSVAVVVRLDLSHAQAHALLFF